jgi:rhodanese-related sulfurtransferase
MDIQVDELKKRKDAGEELILVDVREPYEHEEMNLGGQLIPLGNIMEAMADLAPHKNEEIIVYCRSGMRSAMAKSLLQQSGFENVRNLLGGVLAWQDKYS